jgi:2,5-furandicarboxylate decarboxylase 1
LRSLSGLKEFAEYLEGCGELLRIDTPLDPKYEIAAVLHEMGKKEAPALLFEAVKGRSMPLVGNLLGTKKRLALALGIEEDSLLQGYLPNMDKRIKPRLLEKKSGRKALTSKKQIDIQKLLPALTYYQKDSGPYITCGITSATDPRNGVIGRGLHRMEVRGKSQLGISLLNPPLSNIYAFHREQGTRMEVATAIGVDPAILISTVLKMPGGIDKLEGAGGLIGEAVCLERAKTVDLHVPANAEIIIEGVIDPKGKETDGTLGESSGYYMSFGQSPTIEITAVTLLPKPYFQAILPWSLEVDHLLAFIHGLNFIPKMKKENPSILDIHFVPGTFGAHAVISMANSNKAEIRCALTMAMSFSNIKQVVAVDGDVNPRDYLEVQWALATRCQPDRDMIVISSMRGQPIDPSAGAGFATAKIGIDATRPGRDGFEKVGFPAKIQKKVAAIINGIEKRG